MLLNAVTSLVALLLIQTPFLWPHDGALAAITIVAAVAAAAFAVASSADRRYRAGVAAAGGLLALSAFALAGDVFTLAVQLATGCFFFVAGIAPQVKRSAPVETVYVPYEERRAA